MDATQAKTTKQSESSLLFQRMDSEIELMNNAVDRLDSFKNLLINVLSKPVDPPIIGKNIDKNKPSMCFVDQMDHRISILSDLINRIHSILDNLGTF